MIVDLKSLLTENPEHSPQSVAQNAQKCGVLPQEWRDQNILKGPTLDQALSNFSDITRGSRMPARQQKKHGQVQTPRLSSPGRFQFLKERVIEGVFRAFPPLHRTGLNRSPQLARELPGDGISQLIDHRDRRTVVDQCHLITRFQITCPAQLIPKHRRETGVGLLNGLPGERGSDGDFQARNLLPEVRNNFRQVVGDRQTWAEKKREDDKIPLPLTRQLTDAPFDDRRRLAVKSLRRNFMGMKQADRLDRMTNPRRQLIGQAPELKRRFGPQ